MTDKTYFVLNVTKKKNMKWDNGKLFPEIGDLKGLYSANDIIELVVMETTTYTYCGLDYTKSDVFSIRKQRINKKGDDFATPQEQALNWLNAKIKGLKPMFIPRCGECDDPVKDKDIHSVIDSGLCWKCRKVKMKEVKVIPQGDGNEI